MMALLKSIGVLAALVCCFLLFTIVCLVAINASDRTKSPNTLLIESWLKQQPIATHNNGFEYTLTVVGTHGDNTSPDQASMFALDDQSRKLTRGFNAACIQTDMITCRQFLHDNDSLITAVIDAYKTNIAQYTRLLSMPYWQESDQFLAPEHQIQWSTLFQLRDLSLMTAIKGVNTTASNIDVDSVTVFLNKDTHFWNNVYHSSRSIMSHSMAFNALKQQLHFASAIAEEDKRFLTQISLWQVPFALTQTDFERILSGEWLFGRNIMLKMAMDTQIASTPIYKQWLAKLFIKPIDDDNLRAEYFVNMVKEPVSTDKSISLIQPEYCNNDNYLQQLWQLRYNPLGKILSCSYYETDIKLRLVNMNNEIEQLRSNLMVTQ
ncbi:hypothetical protein [Shewanella sp.]|uniref:hypothetical protein n=1 Tax=Shewanella sp. TaxID=50422 RepID=UPI0040478A66